MDAIVEAALKKWPNVPACTGWLALDARGHWYMRDERVQRLGPFARVKGSRIEHDKLLAFIGRNYACDAGSGDWFFQNGPQRVYVELEAAPWVWRLEPAHPLPRVSSHTALAARPTAAWLDQQGRLFLDTDLGFGLVHTLDMTHALPAVESGAWTPQTLPFEQMPARFGYRLSPHAARSGGSAAAAT